MNAISAGRGALAAVAVAAALGLAACGGDEPATESGDGAEASAPEVAIKTFMYEPSPLTVEAGTTVTFTNEDDILHTVTAGTRAKPSGDFDEDLDGAGAAAEVTFDRPGTIDYFCDVHQGMDGQVVVE